MNNIRRARLGVERLEDRTVPSTVTVERIADAAEGGAAGLFQFARTGDLSQELVVSYTVGGTASPGDDYTSFGFGTTATILFATWEATARQLVEASADLIYDPDETVVATLQDGTGYTVGTASSASLTIVDGMPVVTVERVADAVEGGQAGSFVFTRTGDLTRPLTVTYSIGGTADLGVDYTGPTGTVTFEENSALAGVGINALHDGIAEVNETVTFTITAAAGYVIGQAGSAELTIVNRPWTVNTTLDLPDANPFDRLPIASTGQVTLRAAIQQANANAAVFPSVTFDIAFAESLFTPGMTTTITLTAGALPTVTANVWIRGPNVNILTIAGTGTAGMFAFAPESTSSIWGLTLKDGVNSPAQGGTGKGGAIGNRGTLRLLQVAITDCRSNDGGAIYSEGVLTIDQSRLARNQGLSTLDPAGANGWGGALSVSNLSSQTTIRNSFLEGNSSNKRGGGIAIRSSARVDLFDTDVTGNTADDWGGGVYNSGGTFSMTRGKVDGNRASVGGGLQLSGGTSTLVEVSVLDNRASEQAGGIFIGGEDVSMTGGEIRGNRAETDTGEGRYGGGVMQQGGTAVFRGVTLSDNRGSNGGGLYHNGGTMTFRDGTVSGNAATEWGGGVYSDFGTLTLDAATFANNTATLGGAKIAKKNNPTITVLPNCVGVAALDIEVDTRP